MRVRGSLPLDGWNTVGIWLDIGFVRIVEIVKLWIVLVGEIGLFDWRGREGGREEIGEKKTVLVFVELFVVAKCEDWMIGERGS